MSFYSTLYRKCLAFPTGSHGIPILPPEVIAEPVAEALHRFSGRSLSTFRGLPVVKVFVNGQPVESDVPAVLMDGHTLVPLRAIAEGLGAVG